MTQEIEKQAATASHSIVGEMLERTNLTRNQLAFWLGERVTKSASMYNMGQVFRLHGEINTTHFRAAFSHLLEQSDALRTRFQGTDDAPLQSVADSLEYSLPIIDISARHDPAACLDAWVAERIATPIDCRDRCFDTALVRLSSTDWAWYFCIHHLIGDGTSVDLIFRYMSAYYCLAEAGSLAQSDPLPQFASYRKKEQEYRTSAAFRADEAWWNERATTECEPVEFYGNRRSSGDNRCIRKSIIVDGDATRQLAAVTEAILGTGVSADLNILTAYLAALAAYRNAVAGPGSLIVGVPFHNRASRADKGTIGLLMEVVPLTIKVGSKDTFATLLQTARGEISTAVRHYRFGSTSAVRSRAYDVMLNLLPSNTSNFAGIPSTTTWVHSGDWYESLTLQVQRTHKGDKLYFDMNTVLFAGSIADRAPTHFARLMENMLAEPGRAIGELHFLTSSEGRRFRDNLWNVGRTFEPAESVVSHFERIVQRYPDARAVVSGEGCVDYRSLNETANRIATFLRGRGVRKGDFVGVCIPRSIERIAAILAILKAGGAYVPLDGDWPVERLGSAIADASVRLIVAKSISSQLNSVAVDRVDLEASSSEISSQPSSNLDAESGPTDAAYINFTSGSTGRPKGVVVPHAGIIRMTIDADYADLGPKTITLNLSSISFDASTFELWGALLCGGCVVLPESPLPTTSSIRAEVANHGVNTLFVTTSLFNVLIDEDPRAFAGIDQLLTGGEAASPGHFSRALSALPRTRLIHCYGPTECTTFTTTFTVTGPVDDTKPVPIGRPVSNTSLHVLDMSMRDVPLGATGELYVSGPAIANEYVSQPELTAERFVRLPGHEMIRAYKTGDVVRVNEDDQMVFVGRRDNQVKVRGFRIELDEVELAINSLDDVRRAAVLLHRAANDNTGIAAYIVGSKAGLTPGSLRKSLSGVLPESMIPRWLVLVDELPIGSTGKLDRSRLPDPLSAENCEAPEVPTDDVVEQRLAVLWREVLGVSRIDRHANFFDLGGDSIRAIQLAARAAAAGLRLDATDVFQFQTLSELANELRGRTPESVEAGEGASVSMTEGFADSDLDAILAEMEG